jgi:hypothetical protein
MHDNPRLDDELAAFTDGLLAGEDAQTPPELDDLAHVVRQLNEIIGSDVHLDPAFRERLTQRLNREWTLQHKRRSHWHSSHLVQLLALAAVIAVTLGALVLLLAEANDKPVQGTALGSAPGIAVVIAVLVGLGVLLIWYYQRRNL